MDLMSYWELIVVGFIVLSFIIITIVQFVKYDKGTKVRMFKSHLLQLVIIAENAFGSKQGEIKFSFVFNALKSKYKWLAVVPNKLIYDLIENTLLEMKQALEGEKENEIQ